MAKSYWLINSNKSVVKRFTKNDKSIDGVFEYMFIDTGKIVGGLGNKPPVMTNTVSDLALKGLGLFLSNGSLAQGGIKPHVIKVVLILPSFLITRTGSLGLIRL